MNIIEIKKIGKGLGLEYKECFKCSEGRAYLFKADIGGKIAVKNGKSKMDTLNRLVEEFNDQLPTTCLATSTYNTIKFKTARFGIWVYNLKNYADWGKVADKKIAQTNAMDKDSW